MNTTQQCFSGVCIPQPGIAYSFTKDYVLQLNNLVAKEAYRLRHYKYNQAKNELEINRGMSYLCYGIMALAAIMAPFVENPATAVVVFFGALATGIAMSCLARHAENKLVALK